MTYLNQYLKPLLGDVKIVFSNDEVSRIVAYLEEECNSKSLTNHFMYLIKLCEFLLIRYQTSKQVFDEESIQDAENYGHVWDNSRGNQKKNNEESIQSNKLPLVKKERSCLVDASLQMAANALSHFPMSDLYSAEKYGNIFIMNAAANAIQNRNNAKLEKPCGNFPNFHTKMINGYMQVAEMIEHIHIIGATPSIMTEYVANSIVMTLKHCTNLRKLEFEDDFIHSNPNYYIEELDYEVLQELSSSYVFRSLINRSTKHCKKLTSLQITSPSKRIFFLRLNLLGSIQDLFSSLNKINEITLKAPDAMYMYNR